MGSLITEGDTRCCELVLGRPSLEPFGSCAGRPLMTTSTEYITHITVMRTRSRTTGQATEMLSDLTVAAKRSSTTVPYSLPYNVAWVGAGVTLPEDGSESNVVISPSVVPVNTGAIVETIVDDLSGSRKTVPHLKNVSHEKLTWEAQRGLLDFESESAGNYGAICTTGLGFTPLIGTITATANIVGGPTVNDKNAVAVRHSAGDYDHVNMAEFFAELRLARDLWVNSAKEATKLLGLGVLRASTKSQRVRLHIGQTSLKETLLTLNSLDLTYQWGIKPFVQGLIDLGETLQRLERYHQNRSDRAGLVTRVSAHTSGTLVPQHLVTNNIQLFSVIRGQRTASSTGTWTYRRTGYYRHTDVRRSVMSDISAIAYSFGLNRPFYSVWKTLQFSFIFDWFLPLGNALSGLRLYSPYAPTLVGACESTLLECTGSVTESVTSVGISSSGINHTARFSGYASGTAVRRHYERSVISNPVLTTAPSFKMPSPGQVASLLQLLWAMASARKR